MSGNNKLAVGLIISLFFLWGLAHNMNPILIPHLKKACQLNDLQSAFIDSAFYIGYFVMAIPAGLLMKKIGYKGGIILGLLLFAAGAFLFLPAASTRTYAIFLAALFIIASGLTFLETAANPYITVLGEPSTAIRRLNFAQSFNGLAATLAPFVGGLFILSGKTLSEADKAAMSAAQLDAYLIEEASSVKLPYVIIGLVVLLVAVVLWRTRLPEIQEGENTSGQPTGSIWKEKNLVLAVMAQLFYMGSQVCVGSFFIRFSGYVVGLQEKAAAMYLSAALLGFMVGRFFGTFLMRYISPARILFWYSIISSLLVLTAMFVQGMVAIYCLVAVQFFMSIMFPTIFSLGIRGLGNKTKIGSSLLIMAIVGGAIFPVIMGRISDITDIQFSYLIPALCFLPVIYFAWIQPRDVRIASAAAVH